LGGKIEQKIYILWGKTKKIKKLMSKILIFNFFFLGEIWGFRRAKPQCGSAPGHDVNERSPPLVNRDLVFLY